jgi:hypothetical protein
MEVLQKDRTDEEKEVENPIKGQSLPKQEGHS